MPTINVPSARGVILVAAGSGTSAIINTDDTFSLWLDDNIGVAAGDPNAISLPPGGSLVVSGDDDVYGVADTDDPGSIQVIIAPGGLAYFLGLTTGFGKLVINSIQSPNYNPIAGTGWIIRKDGSAVFHSVSIPAGSGGATVTFAPVAPTVPPPNPGDLWYDTSNGMLLNQWTGSIWQPYQISGDAIAPGGIGNAQIGVGAVDGVQISPVANILGTQIANATIMGNNIAAAQISAELLNVGDTLNTNPYFGNFDLTGWGSFSNSGPNPTLTGVATSSFAYPYAAQLVAGVGSAFPQMFGNNFAVNAGDPIQVNGWFNTNCNLQFAIVYTDQFGGFLGQTVGTVLANPGVWQYSALVGNALPGSVEATLAVKVTSGSTLGTEVFQATGLTVLSKVHGGLIEAGTITAAQINVADLIANGINTQTLTAVNLLEYNGTSTPTVNELLYSSGNSQYQDTVGNWVLAGEVMYGADTIQGSGYIAVQILNGVMTWYTATVMTGVTSPWVAGPSITFSAAAINGLSIGYSAGTIIINGTPVVIEGPAAHAPQVSPALIFQKQASTPNASGNNAVAFANASGEMVSIDGGDGTTYPMGVRTVDLTANSGSISTNTPQSVGLSSAIGSLSGARRYRFHARLFITTTSTPEFGFELVVSAAAAGQVGGCIYRGTTFVGSVQAGPNATAAIAVALSAGVTYMVDLDGEFSTTAANGTVNLNVFNNTSGTGSFTVNQWSYIEVKPI